jgi:type II secretory pathway pseudopilin PulG
MTDPHLHTPPNRLNLAVISLRIGAVIYALIAVGTLLVAAFVESPDPSDPADRWVWLGMLAFLAVIALGMAGVSELIVRGLHRRRTWAWIAGLCVFGLYVPSLFFALGGLGLWGLLDPGSRSLFGMGQTTGPQPGSLSGGGAARSSRGPGCVIAVICAVALLVVALPILGIISAILIPNFIDALSKAKQLRTVSDLRQISVAIETARASTGRLPDNAAIEQVLQEVQEHSDIELRALDAWNRPLRYACWSDDGSGGCTSYALVSAGRDGLFEHEDPREYLAPPPAPSPTASAMTQYDADLALVDGVVVRDRYLPGG